MSRRVAWRQLAPLLALVLGTLLFVVACGDDGGGDASPTPSDDTAQPTASPGDGTAAPVTFPASINGCDLAQDDELVRFLGDDPVNASGNQGGNNAAFCNWVADYEGNVSSVSLQMTTSGNGFDIYRNEPSYEPLADVGDEAYMQTGEDLLSGPPSYSIAVRNGIYHVLFYTSGPLEGSEAVDEMLTVLQRLLQDLP